MNRRGFFKGLGALFGWAALPSLPAIAAVTTISRPLVATWTIEPMLDLVTYHGVDLEDELAAIMAKHIQEEIDNEILNDLHKLA